MGFLFGCLCVFYPVAWYLSSEAMMVKAQPSLWRVTTAQLVMKNLLCSLATEASSLEGLPTSILITPPTGNQKISLFLTFPFSFWRCPVAFASRCSSPQAVSAPLHTWWNWQTAEIELCVCESSICHHLHIQPPLIRHGCTDPPAPATVVASLKKHILYFLGYFFPRFSSTLNFRAVVRGSIFSRLTSQHDALNQG